MATLTSPVHSPEVTLRRNLPRRDYYLIPLLSLATIIVMFVAAEVTARILYPEKDYDECRVLTETDPRRAKPNCTVNAKVPEGPWVTYSMNECGYRTSASCGPKPAGTLRLALMGASMTMAKNVPIEQSWGEVMGRTISSATGRKVEVENMGWELLSPLHCYRQLYKAIAMKPDVVVYAINSYDLSREMDPAQLAHRNDRVLPPLPPEPPPPDRGIIMRNIVKGIQNTLNNSRALTMAQHFLFSNPDTYLKVYLKDADRADFVRRPFTPAWRTYYSNFNIILTDMAARLHKAGIPFIVVGLPARAQVIMLMKGKPYPPGTDPLAFDQEIQQICSRNGVPYLSAMDAFSKAPDGDKLFFILDQHITAEGDAIIADLVSRKCLDGTIPAFQRQLSETRPPFDTHGQHE